MQIKHQSTFHIITSTAAARCPAPKSGPVELSAAQLALVSGGISPKGTWAPSEVPLSPKGTW